MITFYDTFTQIVVSQTMAAEFVHGFGVRTLSKLILDKMMLTHRTYELIASPRDVNEQGITNEISWRAGNIDGNAPLSSWQDRLEECQDSFDMNGGFINHGSPEQPSWGSHS
jgi:hypothetical protein